MSRTAQTTIFLGEDQYTACLRIGELISLQDKTGSGPMAIAKRLGSGDWLVQDIRETIRHGLRGGGELTDREIARLIDTYVIEGSLMEYQMAALAIITASIMGADDEPIEGADEPEVDGDDEGNLSAP